MTYLVEPLDRRAALKLLAPATFDEVHQIVVGKIDAGAFFAQIGENLRRSGACAPVRDDLGLEGIEALESVSGKRCGGDEVVIVR